MGDGVVNAAQGGLQELLSVGDDVRTTQINGVTQHMQEPEPALNNAVVIHCIDHCSDIVVGCIDIPVSAAYRIYLSQMQRFSSGTNNNNTILTVFLSGQPG